jgi:hypothetical protein
MTRTRTRKPLAEFLAREGRLSYDNAANAVKLGLMSHDDWNRFLFLWSWSAIRYDGIPGMAQERYYRRHGAKHFYDRINRVRRIAGCEPYPYPD